MHSPTKILCLLLLLFAARDCCGQAPLANWYEIKGEDFGFSEGDRFAQSVATDGNLIVAGSIFPGEVVHVFRADSGELLHELKPEDEVDWQRFFGSSVAVDGDFIVVGDRGDGDNGLKSGAAYVFDAKTGKQIYKLKPSNGHAGGNFGGQAAIENGIVLIGSPSRAPDASAFLFDLTNGEELHKLVPNEPSGGTAFGSALDISGNLAVVGAKRDPRFGAQSGAAYVFDVMTGELLSVLASDTIAAGHGFGSDLAIEGGVVVVNSRNDSTADGRGAAFVFSATSGKQLLAIHPDLSLDRIESVALSGSIVAASFTPRSAGTINLYDLETGLKITEIETPFQGNFGINLDFAKNTLVATDAGASQLGKIVVFDVPEPSVTTILPLISFCYLIRVLNPEKRGKSNASADKSRQEQTREDKTVV